VISPFRIAVDAGVLDDLEERLARTRFSTASDDVAWKAGTDPDYLRELVEYWREEFDWREVERRLNELPHALIEVDGTKIHVVHVRAPGDSGLPLMLSHGWPSAFIEMLPLVPLLTEPPDPFDLIIPSLPGIGFSELPSSGPLTRSRIAGLWARLMEELGYDRFGTFGGDIGADVSNWLAIEHSERVIGLHTIHPGIVFPDADDPTLTNDERRFFAWLDEFDELDRGYSEMQGTRPDTLAAALVDSPAGLAAWIVDKFRAWSDNDGDLESAVGRDDLVSIVTLYWVTGSIGTSFRTYYDYGHNRPRTPIDVPVGVTTTIEEPLPRSLSERLYRDIRQWREPGVGGHFMAMEQPDLLARDLRDFFAQLR
jgi:pimeloyl-ACP methyl ester carboxylesterase